MLLAATACNNPVIDNNASDPTGGFYWASETSVVHLRVGTEDRIVLAYNDQEGHQRLDGTYLPNPSAAGLSLSTDAGRTWRKLPNIPANSSCTTPGCIKALRADPWLATNGSVVNYSFLGSTIGFLAAPESIVVAISTDGESWSQPLTALQRMGHDIDKESISMSGDTSAIAFVDIRDPVGSSRIGIATSDSSGIAWTDGGDLDVPLTGPEATRYPQTPVIQLVSPTEGYIAYIGFVSGINNQYAIHVVRVTRAIGATSWSIAGELFRRTGISYQPSISAGPGIPNLGDGIPISFAAVKRPEGTRLYLTWREDNSEAVRSKAKLADCLEASPGACSNTPWRIRELDASRGLQLQPSVTAHPNGTVAVAWYQGYYDLNGSLLRIFTNGVYSTDAGNTLSIIYDLRPTNIDWSPCPRATGYYGDYWSSVIVPGLSYGGRPWIVSAHTDSTRSTNTAPIRNDCTSFASGGGLVYDHHVQAVVW
jgi:hypothetical protein